MPDVAQHHVFGMEVRAALPGEIRDFLADTPYLFGLYGPDTWFVYHPWKPRRQGRGRRMHTTKTGEFLTGLARQCREGTAPREVFSYLAGFLCHYALDSTAHPYIIWQSTETWPTRRAHRDLEHALDIALLQREGYWGERHPITAHHFPRLRLPKCMAKDLAAVYLQVYGWNHPRGSLNRCCWLFRKLYRVMERPHSLLTFLSRLIPTPGMRSLPYARCGFLDRDAENLSHQPWHEAYAREMTSTASYPELYDQAREEALRMIQDAYAFLQGRISLGALQSSLGNRSYLSGLDAEDPRNMMVRSLRPPK